MTEFKAGKVRASIEDQVNVSLKRYPRVYDYFVDFFGILIPGVTFWLLFLLIIYSLYYCWANTWLDECSSPLEPIKSFKWELIFFSIVISYVLGFLFFRKGPKLVDIESVKAQYKSIKYDNPPILGALDGKIDFSKDVQWPYEYLKRYLSVRLPHLAKLVPWDPLDKSDQSQNKYKFFRSKMFMNVLKDTIKFHFPDKYLDVARNEALVRLSSSIWYAMKYLFNIAGVSMLIVFAIIMINVFNKPVNLDKLYIYTSNIIFLAIVMIAAWHIRRQIKKVLFYQRIREIVYILNTAFQACKLNPDFGLEFFKYAGWEYKWFTNDDKNNKSASP